ncbi:hypothetical protein BJ742DRAFT_207699 [Cladochytrium replicatum]|nr:hypothetical protein BJ742DRAFT_207699 [Cladochytrium replicatum]
MSVSPIAFCFVWRSHHALRRSILLAAGNTRLGLLHRGCDLFPIQACSHIDPRLLTWFQGVASIMCASFPAFLSCPRIHLITTPAGWPCCSSSYWSSAHTRFPSHQMYRLWIPVVAFWRTCCASVTTHCPAKSWLVLCPAAAVQLPTPQLLRQ